MNEAQITAVKEAADAVDQALLLLEHAAKEVGRGDGGREVALAKTNVEQGGLWLDLVIRQNG
jgi:hypothetical protein